MTGQKPLWPTALLAFAAAAQVQAAPDPATGLIAAEDRYTNAIVSRDIAKLGDAVSKDLIYVHASGKAENKRQYLQGTLEGGFRVVGARITERQAKVVGNLGVTLGKIAYDVGASDGEKLAGYMAVYRKERGRWLLLRWQNAKPSGPTGGK